MSENNHPDRDRWWERKWKIAVFGCIFSSASILTGLAIAAIWPKTGGAVEPFSRMGAWTGFAFMLTFALPAAAENIADKIWSKL